MKPNNWDMKTWGAIIHKVLTDRGRRGNCGTVSFYVKRKNQRNDIGIIMKIITYSF